MIKPLIWVLWSEEAEGADSTFQSLENPTAILHYYWSPHWDTQRGIDLHTSESRKTPLNHLGLTQLQEDGSSTCESTSTHRHKERRGKGRQTASQAYKSLWRDTSIHWFAWLPAHLSVFLPLHLNIDIPVWSAPGYHCQSCNDTSGENWCMRQLIFRNTPLLVHKQGAAVANRKGWGEDDRGMDEGARGGTRSAGRIRGR